ncbi:cation diffusion facilitator family transporter [Rhodohalobacter barkolensis]|uniref:Cation transporter n=1 Tax=Rhodohalobacter barkolensis TaxID=2053187 RepID=A0A2N0VEE0_9BACT|nr:cation diffusion facilitator family transporter [Rhodohalobacter barkolensis]PKD42488.1 cation transporter [Rhodohalobacter barkolensis]
MAHTHSHDHTGKAISRLWFTFFLNLGISVAQLIGGFLSNSMALISDAVHNLSDTGSVGVSLVARKYANKSADKQMTFGYRRADIIGAFINLIILIGVSLFLVKEGIERFLQPEEIDGSIMFWVALVGLVGNVLSVYILHSDSKRSLNIKSAYVHLFWDAAASLTIIVGGVLILYYDLYIIDPILTIGIALYILYTTYNMLRETVSILMEATPEDIHVDSIKDELESISHVRDVHHIHVWKVDEHQKMLECHAHIDKSYSSLLEEIKSEIKACLSDRFDITHSAIEFELEPCESSTHHP